MKNRIFIIPEKEKISKSRIVAHKFIDAKNNREQLIKLGWIKQDEDVNGLKFEYIAVIKGEIGDYWILSRCVAIKDGQYLGDVYHGWEDTTAVKYETVEQAKKEWKIFLDNAHKERPDIDVI